MSDQRELPLSFPELSPEAPFIPVRMVNEYVYCPRLAYLEWVQGEFAHNADTLEGAIRHRRVDKGEGALPEEPKDDETIHARSVALSSARLGITAKIDLVEGEGMRVTPVDTKRGKRPHVAAGAYDPERVQVCAQGLLLREHGYECEAGVLYFAGSKERVRLGTRLGIAYFDQFRAALDEEGCLADTISPRSEYLDIDGARKHVIGYLGDFLFPPERVRALVKSLSGGERNRLLLARLFSRPANVLVLDEPTNDLDIETLELLEDLLQDYSGTLFLVSHDRAFLDNVVTQTIAFEGEGRWKEYAGGYSDWQRAKAAGSASSMQDEGAARAEQEPGTRTRAAAGKAKLSYKEGRELAELPARVRALEREQGDIALRLGDPALYREQPEQVKEMQARFAEIEELLMQALSRWEALEAKR